MNYIPTHVRRISAVGVLLLTALLAACSDRAITDPSDTPLEFASPAYAAVPSSTLSQSMKGDTTVTVFVLGTNRRSTTQSIGNSSTIKFSLGAASICNIAKSSYGAGTWDLSCTASTSTVTITAKTWINAKGKVSSEFSPAMRFVPSSSNNVTLALADIDGTAKRIDYCAFGFCMNEALFDASLTTTASTSSATSSSFARSVPTVSRRIKHFSGYSVTAD